MEAVVRPRRPVEDLARHTALQHVFDCINVGVAITVEDGKLIEVNNELLTLLGVDREAALGLTLETLLAGDLALSDADDLSGPRERTFTRTDGRRLWVRVTVREVTGRDGRESHGFSGPWRHARTPRLHPNFTPGRALGSRSRLAGMGGSVYNERPGSDAACAGQISSDPLHPPC